MGLNPRSWSRKTWALTGASAVAVLAVAAATGNAWAGEAAWWHGHPKPPVHTATPIKHVVVIFDENISFDHYFGTYPKAANTDGTPFHVAPGTPKINGLTPALLHHNPNLYNPRRLTHEQAMTCDQNHNYLPEQLSYNRGKDDKFVENVSVDTCTGLFGEPGLTMDYYDGNTVTGMWNYAQHFALSDNSFNTVFGPSTPGAINLISGQTHGIYSVDSKTGEKTPTPDPYTVISPDENGIGTMINDPDPSFDDCSDKNHTSTNALGVMTGRNIGDLLNDKGATWGWFQGGFRPTGTSDDGWKICGATHTNVGGAEVVDYSPHHNPFAYYESTSNPKHLPPSSVAKIGHTDRANHNYDLRDFDAAVKAGNLPAVSFLKAPSYQDGHAGYSDPLDEQHFVVDTINKLQKSKQWDSTAIFIAYDDSDGWYDHVTPPLVNGSNDAAHDDLSWCGRKPAAGGYLDRCGYGPRLPLLAISPYSKRNFVDHNLTDQTSILRFIEDNWRTDRIGDYSYDAKAHSLTNMFDFRRHPDTRPVLLDPNTGAVTSHH